MALRLILGCRIRWCSRKFQIFKIDAHEWHRVVHLGPKYRRKFSQMFITSQLKGIKSWNLAFRPILWCRIRVCSQKFQIFKIGAHLWRRVDPFRPKIPPKWIKYLQLLYLNGIKSWKLAFRPILWCRIRLCSQKFQIFKIWGPPVTSRGPFRPKIPPKWIKYLQLLY